MFGGRAIMVYHIGKMGLRPFQPGFEGFVLRFDFLTFQISVGVHRSRSGVGIGLQRRYGVAVNFPELVFCAAVFAINVLHTPIAFDVK